MKIKTIISQCRRDFTAEYECDWCGYTYKGRGYDDANFHQIVIPQMKCPECMKAAGNNYRALTTKYPDNMIV